VGEVLAGEGDVKKDERCSPVRGAARWGLGASCVKPRVCAEVRG